MRFAIWAIDASIREALRDQLARYMEDHGFAVSIDASGDGVQLIQQAPDAAVLCIAGHAEAGLALARLLREKSARTELVFASDTAAHAADVIALRASGYVLLPGEAEMRAVLDGVALRMGLLRRYYVVHTRASDWLVPHADIRYFRSDGHYVHVHLEDGRSLAHLGRLDDIQRETAESQYVRCHQSYLVSRRAIDSVQGTKLLLKNGEQIPVSRRYAAALAGYGAENLPSGRGVEECAQ